MTDTIKLSDGSWIRWQNIKALYLIGTGPKLPIDVDWFVNEGPGRYVVPQHFSGVVALLNGSMKLAPGRYNLVTSSDEPNYDPKALFDVGKRAGKQADRSAMTFQLSNYMTDTGSKDHSLRSKVFGTSAFRVKSGTVNVHQDGRVEIHDLQILPLDDNFNLNTEGKPPFVEWHNRFWTYRNDPSGRGRGIDLEFRLQPGQTGRIFKSVTGDAPGEPNPVYGPDDDAALWRP